MANIHLVCNAHLDPVWMWEWEEGAAAAISTFRTAADICEKFEHFIFNHNEAVLYEWIEEFEPSLFARIQKLVAEGKWHIMGGWYIQPDCNMPSGESILRQIQAGRNYFAEKFGKKPTTAINFDPFGHSQGMVQLLAKTGYDSYIFCRGIDGGSYNYPFVWKGYCDSQVIGLHVPGYNSPLGKAADWAKARGADLHGDGPFMVLWGVGDHGGGPSHQDVADLGSVLGEHGEHVFLHSVPESYFAEIKKNIDNLPVVAKSLNPSMVGCYTSQCRIKQTHRLLENELLLTEKICTNAALQGYMNYPAENVLQAQRDLLFSEFHDILPGSSVQLVEDASLRKMQHALEHLSTERAKAFFALCAGQPAAQPGEIPVVVYNPHPYPVKALVECEFQLADQNWADNFTVTPVTKDGVELKSQNLKEHANLNLDWRKRVAFWAELAPSQINRFDCRTVSLPAKPAMPEQDETKDIVLSNDRLQMIVSRETGMISSYVVDGVEMIADKAMRLLVIQDNEDPWGMTVNSFRDVIGSFTPMSPERSAQFSGVRASSLPATRIVEHGDVITMVESCLEFEYSSACVQFLFPTEGIEVEIRLNLFWNEKNRMCKLAVGRDVELAQAVGQVMFGTELLAASGDELVAQKWVASQYADGRSLSIVNDGTYGLSIEPCGEVRLSLLRSTAYSGHPIGDRPIMPQNRYMPRIDQGERHFKFWLNAGCTDSRMMEIDREALAHNEKPIILSFFPHGGGEMPLPGMLCEGEGVQVTALQFIEGGSALLMRLFNPTQNTLPAKLSIPALKAEISTSLRPLELQAFRVENPSGAVRACDLLGN